jgi:hypothetical protein
MFPGGVSGVIETDRQTEHKMRKKIPPADCWPNGVDPYETVLDRRADGTIGRSCGGGT